MCLTSLFPNWRKKKTACILFTVKVKERGIQDKTILYYILEHDMVAKLVT